MTHALLMMAESQGINLAPDAAKEAVTKPGSTLPLQPDGIPALKTSKGDALRTLSLPNAFKTGGEAPLKNASSPPSILAARNRNPNPGPDLAVNDLAELAG